MLMNIHTCKWDEGMCEALGIPMACLPEIRYAPLAVYAWFDGLPPRFAGPQGVRFK
jgi:glycerol kinase